MVVESGATWLAAAITDGDRAAAAEGVVEADGFRVHLLSLDPETYRLAYDVVSNEVLWFAHHGLWDLTRAPAFDRSWPEAWAAYRSVNRAFAEAVAADAPEGAVVLVQDYHLSLIAEHLAVARPDLACVHFSHTPFAPPVWLSVLPEAARRELLVGLAAHKACGFHTHRWADDFRASASQLAGVEPTTFVSPLALQRLRRAIGPQAFDQLAGDGAQFVQVADADLQLSRRPVVGEGDDGQVHGADGPGRGGLRHHADAHAALHQPADRIELSKNLLRGFQAFGDLLEHHPEHRERVVFVAGAYPSRAGVVAYATYRAELEACVADVNERFGTPGWQPIVLHVEDDFPRSVALLRRADVLLVNAIRDGQNLVASEGALVNERAAVLALSPEAGAWERLHPAALPVQPYDVAGTADVLHRALTMPAEERQARADQLRLLAEARTPAHWLADQLAAAAR